MSPFPLQTIRSRLIVGGGFTGLWAALQAKERIPELDVILIEATEIGLGASGRNGGFISNSLAHGETNAEYHFPGEVEKLTELGDQNLQEILDALERYDIDAHFDETGSIHVTTHPSRNEELAEWVEKGREPGVRKDLCRNSQRGSVQKETIASPRSHNRWRRDYCKDRRQSGRHRGAKPGVRAGCFTRHG